MKTIKFLTFTGIIILSVFVISCQKKTSELPELTNGVVGSYKGTLKNGSTGSQVEATADVIKTDESIVQIHCYSSIMDTTFVMEIFENGDSMMVCNIGDDFKNQYGHGRMEKHHMMGNTDWQSWSHHMDEEHDRNDEHFGGFNMKEHSFDYDFMMKDNQNEFTLMFNGKKQ